MNPYDRVEKLLSKRAETITKTAVLNKDLILGRRAVELITQNGEISVSTLRAFIIQQISGSRSSSGECAPEQDLQLQADQVALAFLEELLARRAN